MTPIHLVSSRFQTVQGKPGYLAIKNLDCSPKAGCATFCSCAKETFYSSPSDPSGSPNPRPLVVLRLGQFYHVADCATYGNAAELSVLPKNLHWYVSARPHSDPHHRINPFPGNHLQTEPLENHGQG